MAKKKAKKVAKKAAKKAAKKRSKRTAAPTLNDLYNKVAAKADTEGVHINVAETKRVIACLFDALEDYSASQAFDFIAKGLKRADQRRR